MSDGTVASDDGTTIACTAWGDGDPIVILDGATAHRVTTPENALTAGPPGDGLRLVLRRAPRPERRPERCPDRAGGAVRAQRGRRRRAPPA